MEDLDRAYPKTILADPAEDPQGFQPPGKPRETQVLVAEHQVDSHPGAACERREVGDEAPGSDPGIADAGDSVLVEDPEAFFERSHCLGERRLRLRVLLGEELIERRALPTHARGLSIHIPIEAAPFGIGGICADLGAAQCVRVGGGDVSARVKDQDGVSL